MASAFKLPDMGEGVHEGEVIAVEVSVEQEVKEGDIILVVETDKAAVEIPSPFDGTVLEIMVKPGDVVNVGDVMMTFSNGEKSPQIDTPPPDTSRPAAEPKAPSPVEGKQKRGPVPASPATRRLARELKVDLNRVTPTGAGGMVTAEDVRAFAEAEKPAPEPVSTVAAPAEPPAISPGGEPLPDFEKWGPVERIPLRSIRRATARHMALAWSQIPHVNSQDAADVTKLEAFRQKHKAEIEAVGGRLTITVFALKAVATALKTFPNFNATLDLAAGEIILKQYFHVGLAVNTDSGLIVPVVRDVDRKSIRELAIEVNDLVQRTRSRKTALEELQGGTFTITNAGAMGGGYFAPIINYPQVAILGMGQGRMQAVVRETSKGHEIVPRLIMPVVLCIDHRVLDGADAIRFLRVVIDALEDPDELLMTMV